MKRNFPEAPFERYADGGVIHCQTKEEAYFIKENHKKMGCKLDNIAETLNPLVRGWMNYFGKFNPSVMKGTLQCIERELLSGQCANIRTFVEDDEEQKNGSAL